MITENINKDLVAAMKAKDTKTLNVLRSVKAAFSNVLSQKGRTDPSINELEAISIIRKLISQRADSIEQFMEGRRFDLAADEKDEIVVLEKYLPPTMDDFVLDGLIDFSIAEVQATSKKDAGKVIKLVIEKANGTADGKRVSAAVMAKLS